MAEPGLTALIDYGAGNLHSVHNALAAAGADQVEIIAAPEGVLAAERIVLPGVGSFRACAEALRGIPGMVEALGERVLGGGAPFLGICVGMQLLADYGHEHGRCDGLGWIAGEVIPLEPGKDDNGQAVRVPHMGWNDVTPFSDGAESGVDGPASEAPRGLDAAGLDAPGAARAMIAPGEAYFLHSYHFAAQNAGDIAALTHHGGPVVAAVQRGNILGVQFHPEKSQGYGLALLRRFLAWQPRLGAARGQEEQGQSA